METFKRKIWEKFKAWKEESDGHTALLVEGARRIGKSTAVEEFAKKEYETYILIDFAFASQNIKNLFNDLYYHTFPSKTSNHNYEIDFVISRKNKVCPIEVKSSDYHRHKSMDIFTEKFSKHIGSRFLVYTKEYRKDTDIFCIPLYLVPFI